MQTLPPDVFGVIAMFAGESLVYLDVQTLSSLCHSARVGVASCQHFWRERTDYSSTNYHTRGHPWAWLQNYQLSSTLQDLLRCRLSLGQNCDEFDASRCSGSTHDDLAKLLDYVMPPDVKADRWGTIVRLTAKVGIDPETLLLFRRCRLQSVECPRPISDKHLDIIADNFHQTLRELHLGECRDVSGSVFAACVNQCRALEHLYIGHGYGLGDDFFGTLTTNVATKFLSLYGASTLTPEDLALLPATFPNLLHLKLTGVALTTEHLEFLCGDPHFGRHLEVLRFDECMGCELNILPLTLQHCPHLKEFRLVVNCCGRAVPSLAHIGRFCGATLERLHLDGVGLDSGVLAEILRTTPKLRELTISCEVLQGDADVEPLVGVVPDSLRAFHILDGELHGYGCLDTSTAVAKGFLASLHDDCKVDYEMAGYCCQLK